MAAPSAAMNWARYVPTFVYSQYARSIPTPTSDFTGQTVIITGSNTGLGQEAARHIVRLNAAKVILAVRTPSKGDAAAADIVRTCGADKRSVLEVWQLDMADRASILAFAERVRQELPRLDAVLLNAGLMIFDFRAPPPNNIETVLLVNHLHTHLLALLLLPVLRSSASKTGQRGRLSIVGSDLMYVADVSELEAPTPTATFPHPILDKLTSPASAEMNQRYQLTKIMNMYTFRALAARSPLSSTSNVLITVMTPGLCESEFQTREKKKPMTQLAQNVFMTLFARSREVGARALVHSVTKELPEEAHGSFLMNCRVAPLGRNVESAAGKRLAEVWNCELMGILEEWSPGCRDCVGGVKA